MKQFLGVVLGGLTAVGTGILGAYLVMTGWKTFAPAMVHFHLSSVSSLAEIVMADPKDGTSIAGMSRTIRWNASQEEDAIPNVTLTLPKTAGNITALSYLAKDLTSATGETVQQNPNQLMPIASLTKLVTAVVARQLIPPDSHITLTSDIMSTYGNTPGFKVGDTFTANDLLYPLLMVSSNDAAEAYAQWYGRKPFIQAMNDFVQGIGAYRTAFSDPSGLSANNVSTANDLALILDWIRRNDPEVVSITQLKAKSIGTHTWINPTHFLSWSNYEGGKNGYTPEANRTAASLFEVGKNKDVYAVIVLGSATRDSDEFSLLGQLMKAR